MSFNISLHLIILFFKRTAPIFLREKILFTFIVIMVILAAFSGCSLKDSGEADTSGEHYPKTAGEETLQEENSPEPEETPEEEAGQLPEESVIAENAKEEEQDMFFVPPALHKEEQNPEVKVKGIYVSGNSAGLEPRFQNFIDMIDSTELNAMVIDVKNDHGVMTYPSEIETVEEMMEDYFEPIRDIRRTIQRLKEKNIYPIARIVVFRDPYLPKFYPEWCIHGKDGDIWTDEKGFAWANPYEKKVWDYNIAIAKEAALMGFMEIQFDYVRFPENAESFDLQVSILNEDSISKDEVIEIFLAYAVKQLKDYNVNVSADVYGVIATYITDKDGIGQTWEKITSTVDYIYPMVYPSHYGPGFFGLSVPDTRPKETILRAMDNAIKRNATVKDPAGIRPWLQGFTAPWIDGNIKYTHTQVREQIDATIERGIEEFFVWNAGNQYDSRSFLTEEEAIKKQIDAGIYRQEMGFDHLGKTASETLEDYLGYISKKNVIQAYPYHASNFEMDIERFSEWAGSWTFDLLEFSILDNASDSDTTYRVDITLKKENESIVLKKEIFKVFMENNIWKVNSPVNFTEALSASY